MTVPNALIVIPNGHPVIPNALIVIPNRSEESKVSL